MQSQQQKMTSHFVDLDFMRPSMEELILDYLDTHSKVTFVDLEDDVPGFAGELAIKYPDNRKTILWQGVSTAALHALHALQTQDRIRFEDTTSRVYHAKGRALNLPVDEWDAAHLHWTPVLVSLNGAPRWTAGAEAGPGAELEAEAAAAAPVH